MVVAVTRRSEVEVQPGAPGILLQLAKSFQAAAGTFTDQLNQFLQFPFIRRPHALKSGWAAVPIHIDAIQNQDMEVNVDVEGRSEALNQRDCPGRATAEL
jgi:hypothetical protein